LIYSPEALAVMRRICNPDNSVQLWAGEPPWSVEESLFAKIVGKPKIKQKARAGNIAAQNASRIMP
jgi:hypothetical protein